MQLNPYGYKVQEGYDELANLAEYEELQYFAEASQALCNSNKQQQAGQDLPEADFVAMETDQDQPPTAEINRLREENNRLKKTLVDRFHQEFDDWFNSVK